VPISWYLNTEIKVVMNFGKYQKAYRSKIVETQ
jgi:hypothetical protein